MKEKNKRHQYKILIERDEDGYFIASVPALPGCHTQSKTLPDLIIRVKDAIKLCLEISRVNSSYQKQIESFAYEPADGRATIVPKHGGEDIGRGLLRQILREIEIAPEQFLEYL